MSSKIVSYNRKEDVININSPRKISPERFGQSLISLMGTRRLWEPVLGNPLDFMFSGYVTPEVKLQVYSTDEDALRRALRYNPKLEGVERRKPNGLVEYLVPIITVKSQDLSFASTGTVSTLVIEKEPALAERKFRTLAKLLKKNPHHIYFSDVL